MFSTQTRGTWMGTLPGPAWQNLLPAWNMLKCYALLNLWNQVDFHSILLKWISRNSLFGRQSARSQYLLTSLFFGISRIEKPLLLLWHHVPFSRDNWCIFLVHAGKLWPFCVTCFFVILRWVLFVCTARRCIRMVRGGVLTGDPGHRFRVSNTFSTAMNNFIFKSC